jgi:hypothetical protein
MCGFCNVWICMCGFCNVWVCVCVGFVKCECVCVGFVMCWCFDTMCTCIYCVFLFLLCKFILCELLLNFVPVMCSYCYVYIFLLLCTFCSIYSVFIVPADILRLPWLSFFRSFSSVVRQMPGYNSQRRGTARTLPKLIVFFCVLFVCKCIQYYCHWVSTQLHLTNISIYLWYKWPRTLKENIYWRPHASALREHWNVILTFICLQY